MYVEGHIHNSSALVPPSALNTGGQQTLRVLTQQQLRLRGGAATQAPLDAEEQGGVVEEIA
eukprot:5485153-Prymnesium_polylepis.1